MDDETTFTEATVVDATLPSENGAVSEDPIALLTAEVEEYKNRWLRARADYDNARKRFTKQQSETYTNTTADVVGKLLPVLDDFERALANVPPAVAEDAWFEGVRLMQRKWSNLLEQLNVQIIEGVGQPFDPSLHEALAQEESTEVASGAITKVLQRGYKIGERVIRPSLVAVAR